jgi:asparagine synthase (glutamine-hydrolysing)
MWKSFFRSSQANFVFCDWKAFGTPVEYRQIMCGICGILNWTSDTPSAVLTAMTERIAHRGPDQAGHWHTSNTSHTPTVGLGFRRLAILDLSPAGHQPMTNETGDLQLVFNGEIYNTPTLRKTLARLGHIFRSRTDTECVLHGYETWGVEVLQQLRGMFAFALWDSPNQRLLLARDRVGIKPLYYYWDGKQFAFASEIKALLTLPQADLRVDLSAVWDFPTYLYIPAPKTAYQFIRQLPAGHFLTLQAGQAPIIQSYWDLQDWNCDVNATWTATQEAYLLEKLRETVQAHLLADVPLGSLLSGGLDSSLVSVLASEYSLEPLKTFSIGFDVESASELPYARQVAAQISAQPFEQIVTGAGLDEQLGQMLSLYDQPFGDASAIPTLAVSQLAVQQVKVALAGDGGDEIFGGYKWYRWWFELQAAQKYPPAWYRLLHSALLPWTGIGRVTGLLARTQAEILSESGADRYGAMHARIKRWQKRRLLPDLAGQFRDYDDHWVYRKYWRNDLDEWTRLQYLDMKTYLPDDILTKVDRASMAVSLEVRPPLLDHELLEYAATLPPAARTNKAILRKIAADLLPAAVLNRPKQGFSVPLLAWQGAQTIRGARLGGLGVWSWQMLDSWRKSLPVG